MWTLQNQTYLKAFLEATPKSCNYWVNIGSSPIEMRPLLSIDSLIVFGMETRDVLPVVRYFFFLGFSKSWNRWLDRDRCFLDAWWDWWECDAAEAVAAAVDVAWLREDDIAVTAVDLLLGAVAGVLCRPPSPSAACPRSHRYHVTLTTDWRASLTIPLLLLYVLPLPAISSSALLLFANLLPSCYCQPLPPRALFPYNLCHHRAHTTGATVTSLGGCYSSGANHFQSFSSVLILTNMIKFMSSDGLLRPLHKWKDRYRGIQTSILSAFHNYVACIINCQDWHDC
jgi:hypothetical protein